MDTKKISTSSRTNTPSRVLLLFLLGFCVLFYIDTWCSSGALDYHPSTNSSTNASTSIGGCPERTILLSSSRQKNETSSSSSSTFFNSSTNSGDDEEENASVKSENQSMEDTLQQNAMPTQQQGILVMVMGEAANFERWYLVWNSFLTQEAMESPTSTEQFTKDNNYSSLSTDATGTPTVLPTTHSFFVYASYDAPISVENVTSLKVCDEHNCFNSTRKNSNTIFIPGTTWTQGRNKLIEEALRLERMFEKRYDYWLFLDDDIEFNCKNDQGFVMNTTTTTTTTTTTSNYICWNKFMHILKNRTLVPQKVTTVTLPRRLKRPYSVASNADAMVAAFKREYVPYLLPYANLRKGESQWTSQAVLFCVMWNCFKQSTYFAPNIHALNTAHRPYTRGGNVTSYQAATAYNYDQYMPLHSRCDEQQHFDQRSDVIKAPSLKELEALIPSMNSSCEVLKRRFFDWVAANTSS